MFAADGFAVAYALYLRLSRQRYLKRRPLSDEEFAAQLPDSEHVDLQVVRQVREMAAKRFRRIGGNRFYPNDRLEEDLHVFDSAPWAWEDFEIDLDERFLDYDEKIVGEVPAETFGDVVVVANRAWQSKAPKMGSRDNDSTSAT